MSFFGSSDKIHVIAQITAKSGNEQVVKATLTSLVAPSLKESGCKQYQLLEDKKSSGTFFTYEEWSSEAALADHLADAKPMLDQLQPLLAGEMKITVLNLIV